MMLDSWYAVVGADQSLTQGDLVFECPIMAWKAGPLQFDGEQQSLRTACQAIAADVIVMTQACDLEHDKVLNVTLCPFMRLSVFREDWEAKLRAEGQFPTTPNKVQKAWARVCDDIRDGHVWNLAMLNSQMEDPVRTEHLVVDFHEVFTVPKAFLESYLRKRGRERLRLLPPYREHLSQAFARFFMRVGLPTGVAREW